jgi:hypothetical protein
MATVATISPVSPIDRLGEIKAEIARLKDIEALLLDEIKAYGPGAYDGEGYRAAVSEIAERKSLDVKAAEAKLRELGVDGRWFSKNQKVTKGYTTVKISARRA